MFELIALTGGFWFFLFVILIVAGGILSSEFDNFLGGGLTLLSLIVISDLVFDIPIFSVIIANPLVVILFIAGYVAVGFLYAILYRYSEFLKKDATLIKSKWEDFKRNWTNGFNPEPTRDDFRNSYAYRKWSPYNNKERITTWVVLWPWGVFWDLCNKPIRFAYRTMYSFAGDLLGRVSVRISNKILDDTK